MFNDWKTEKATVALIDAAQDLADKLVSAKPHFVETHAAAAQFWGVEHLIRDQDLWAIVDWKPAMVARFVRDTQTRIAALRKARDYASSDGLAIWLHTARAITEPRLMPPVRDIWAALLGAGVNADAMLRDMLDDAGLPPGHTRRGPKGFCGEG